jgi:biopolymer transport protein ExbD
LSDLSYERLLNKSSAEEKAAIVLSQPEQIFTITLTNRNKIVLKTYPIPIDEYRDEFGRTVKFDLNRLYISFNNDAIIAIANYVAFDPVLKDLSSFRLKN